MRATKAIGILLLGGVVGSAGAAGTMAVLRERAPAPRPETKTEPPITLCVRSEPARIELPDDRAETARSVDPCAALSDHDETAGEDSHETVGASSGCGGAGRSFGGRVVLRSAGGGCASRATSPPGRVEPPPTVATRDAPRPPAPALLTYEGGALTPLALEALRISAVLGPTRARVIVDATFRNPLPRRLEATLFAALPEGASPCSLGLFQGEGCSGEVADFARLLPPPATAARVLEGASAAPSRWADGLVVEWGELRTGRVVEPSRGARVYEGVARRQVDPALLEWSGTGTFSTRVFPIAARGRKRIVIAYDQTPRDVSGRALVPLPVPATPPPACRIEGLVDTRHYSRGVLLSGATETPLVADETTARAELTPSAAELGGFALAAMPRDARVAGGSTTASAVPGSLVHVRVHPNVAAATDRATGDAVFLLDTSLSQRAALAPSFGRLLGAVLERDATIRRFRVVTFDVRARTLGEGWRANTAAERASVLAEVDGTWLEGATSLEAALAHLDATIGKDEHPTFFLLSDAVATWGADEPRELERAFPRLLAERWIGYAVGDAPVNRPFLERLAREGGRVIPIVGAADVEAAAVAHRAAPVLLRDVRVEGVAAQDLVVAGAPRALFPGQTLEVAFRAPSEALPAGSQVVVETSAGAERFSLAGVVSGDALAGRAWAELWANALLERGGDVADRTALALSQRFGLVNRKASLLLLESDADEAREGLRDEVLDLAGLARVLAPADPLPIGAPDTTELSREARAFVDRVRGRRGAPWPGPGSRATSGASFVRPTWPTVLDPVAVHSEAVRRHEAGLDADAVRILSSIVEEAPREGRALRLVAWTLFAWGAHDDAASLLGRVRTLRPFEAPAWLAEAFALEAQGAVGEAAVRYERVLAGGFASRQVEHALTLARRSYARLLGELGSDGARRARELRLPASEPVTFEATLLWSQDDSDLDLHVREADRAEVDYNHTRSPGGGRLHWDDTAGLGPELYTHPSAEPAEVSVAYYGSSSVGGAAPASALLVLRRGAAAPEVACGVLREAKARVVLWRR